jgi:Tfp pilus assembly protein PilV
MNINKKIRDNNKGITYLEIILAAAIITYIVMGFAQMFIKNNIALNQSKMQTMAANWASDEMENIKSHYYSDITTTTFTAETQVLGDVQSFTRVVNISELEEGLKEIEIKISWTELSKPKELRIVSYVADYEG